MSSPRKFTLLALIALVLVLVVAAILFRLTLICCAFPPTPTLTAAADQALNQPVMDTVSLFVHTPLTPPYDSTLYAQRDRERLAIMSGGGPTEYARFFQTEYALVITYQGTVPPTLTRTPRPPTATPPYDPTLYAQRQHEYQLLSTAGGPTEYARFDQTEQALIATYQGTVPPTSSPTPTGIPLTCAWQWARQDLPDITQQAQTAFLASADPQIAVIQVRAEAYGENCLNTAGDIAYFAAMTTDFYLTVPVPSFTDVDQLAHILTTAYHTLLALPDDDLPPNPGYLDITFTSADESRRLRVMFSQLRPAITDGLTGLPLLEAAGGLR